MADSLLVEIVSPDRAAYRGEARAFRAPGVEGSFDRLPDSCHALLMPRSAGQAPLLGPPAITVHDDRDMTRNIACRVNYVFR